TARCQNPENYCKMLLINQLHNKAKAITVSGMTERANRPVQKNNPVQILNSPLISVNFLLYSSGRFLRIYWLKVG
ncbi:MAG: hypothetical protein ACQEQV_02445, partial [Fibrobacterota bacterium]